MSTTDSVPRSMALGDLLLRGQAVLLLTLAKVGLRLLGFRLLIRTLSGSGTSKCHPARIASVSDAVNGAGHRLRFTCLPRAFAAAWMLQRYGMRPILHYGVAAGGEGTVAHAWVEVDGCPVVGQEGAKGMSLLASFP